MHPACPNQKQNHLENRLLRRTQFWVRKTFSKPASLKRASLVAESCGIQNSIQGYSLNTSRSLLAGQPRSKGERRIQTECGEPSRAGLQVTVNPWSMHKYDAKSIAFVMNPKQRSHTSRLVLTRHSPTASPGPATSPPSPKVPTRGAKIKGPQTHDTKEKRKKRIQAKKGVKLSKIPQCERQCLGIAAELKVSRNLTRKLMPSGERIQPTRPVHGRESLPSHQFLR